MSGPDFSPVEGLARRCAERGLQLRDARRLFEELYLADALMLEGGRMTGAAERMGQTASNLYRRRCERERGAE